MMPGLFGGTRPEAIQIAPVYRARLAGGVVRPVLVSSGRHHELLHRALAALGLPAELDLYFEPDRKVFTSRRLHDLVEKLRLLLADERLRSSIARAGLAHAWDEHTYQHRVTRMLYNVSALRGETAPPEPTAADVGGS